MDGMELVNDGYIEFKKGYSAWLLPFPEVFEWNGNGYLFESMDMPASELPREFYAHQLLEVNPRDTDSLLGFLFRWGLPYNPCRDNGGWPYRPIVPMATSMDFPYVPYARSNACMDRRMLAGLIATNAANGLKMERISNIRFAVPAQTMYLPKSLIREAADGTEWGNALNHVGGRIISVTEASAIIEASQTAIRSILAWVKGAITGKYETRFCRGENFPIAQAWNFADFAASDFITTVDDFDSFNANLISVVFDQLKATLLSPEPWRICEACGKPFKRKQLSPNATPPKTERYSSRSKYCCEKCRNNEGNRRKKEAAKARIDHGI